MEREIEFIKSVWEAYIVVHGEKFSLHPDVCMLNDWIKKDGLNVKEVLVLIAGGQIKRGSKLIWAKPRGPVEGGNRVQRPFIKDVEATKKKAREMYEALC